MESTLPSLHISLAGRVVVRRNGVEHEVRGRHPRVLLAILLSERNRTVTRDELAEALWGDSLPSSWQSSLRVALSKLRAFLVTLGLDPGALASTGGGYRLRIEDAVDVDVEGISEVVQAAERALATRDPATACAQAVAAHRVLAHPLLPGAEGPWVEDRREEMRRLLVRALEAEAEGRAASGDAAAAIAVAEEAVALEPFRESAHRILMRAHVAGGNRAEALRCYERCRQILADELGVDPSPPTEGLYLQLLRDEPLAASLPPPPASAGTDAHPDVDVLQAGRAALETGHWQGASLLLARADGENLLEPEDLERWGEAAMLAGQHLESVAARRRAHAAYLDRHDARGAARTAMALVANHAIRLEPAVAEGWFRTAARLLEDQPEGPDHGFLAFLAAVVLLDTADFPGALDQARRAFEIGERFAVPDLQALGLALQGCALARQERIAEALPLLDEGMARATSGRLSPLAAGMVFCRTVWVCVDVFDFRRAAEWMQAIEDCALEGGFAGFSGDCHAHRASVLLARGSWGEAEREAERAYEECERFDLSHVGLASYALGEIHLRRGDLVRAARAFERANEHGVVPQPGAALLEAAAGDAAAALASLKGALAGTLNPLARVRLLPAAVDVALAAGQPEWARGAAEELETIALTYGGAALAAAAARARGAVRLAEGDVPAATAELRRAADQFRSGELPYELARTRELLADALLEAGDHKGAVMELSAAAGLFARLGAAPDARAAQHRLDELQFAPPTDPGGWVRFSSASATGMAPSRASDPAAQKST